eukprot:1138151-Pelagomonas_calceolata.AAC.2
MTFSGRTWSGGGWVFTWKSHDLERQCLSCVVQISWGMMCGVPECGEWYAMRWGYLEQRWVTKGRCQEGEAENEKFVTGDLVHKVWELRGGK